MLVPRIPCLCVLVVWYGIPGNTYKLLEIRVGSALQRDETRGFESAWGVEFVRPNRVGFFRVARGVCAETGYA